MGLECGRPVHGKEAITIVLGRFEPVFEDGLTANLGGDPGISVVGAGQADGDLECSIAEHKPRLAIVDGRTSTAYLLRLRDRHPATRLITLAPYPTRRAVRRLLAEGVSCIPQSVSVPYLLDVVRVVAGGARIARSVDGYDVCRRYPEDAAPLTPREREVFDRVSRGEQRRDIAHELDIGVETVQTHTTNIRRKLGVGSVAELVGMPAPSSR